MKSFLKAAVSTFLLVGTVASAAIEDPVELFNRQAAGVVIRQCNRPGVLALAYDDGPGQYTSQLVDILNNAGAKATLFLTGTLYGCIYNQQAAIKKAYNSGHQIASHTWTHPQNFGSLSTDQLKQEMQKVEQALVNIIGKKPAYMRPPYLATGGNVLPTMQQLGYKVITDDVDSGDWNGQSAQQSLQKFQQAGAGGNGHIPLMHETYASTVQTLTPALINWAKQNNLKLVTVGTVYHDERAYIENVIIPDPMGQCGIQSLCHCSYCNSGTLLQMGNKVGIYPSRPLTKISSTLGSLSSRNPSCWFPAIAQLTMIDPAVSGRTTTSSEANTRVFRLHLSEVPVWHLDSLAFYHLDENLWKSVDSWLCNTPQIEHSIPQSEGYPAFGVHGDIRIRFNQIVGGPGLLGCPLTDETTTRDGRGRFNNFRIEAIYWTIETKAWEVYGDIRNK
ncbi:hypothetical protein DER44DRAFT_660856 [Fusarium oxysporum]|nr:hypothetical protein DER44DRAFT_660856 [Fusarium oxysporum]